MDRAEPTDEPPTKAIAQQMPATVEVETDRGSINVKVVPLTNELGPIGILLVLRDTTELRRRERQLVTKDATIREIHHRVKNNLQTVAALLRLQARRIQSEEGVTALHHAMSRVQAIAIVHEILSQTFDGRVEFDDVMDRLLRHVGDVAASRGMVTARREGTFGDVAAAAATSLSLVLTELCQNAIEHGFSSGAGEVVVKPIRKGSKLRIEVTDNGRGLPTTSRRPSRRAWACRSSRRWSPTCTVSSSSVPTRTGQGPAPWSRFRSDQPARMRERAARRLSARRSSSLIPPQTPWSCPASSAHCRQRSRTSQRAHTRFASSIWSSAGPVLPIGKNSSGSSVRQAALSRQSIRVKLLVID
jgi:two-component sensor histidine kinase